MSDGLTQQPSFLDDLAFLVRVTQQDGRAIEDALAGPTLFDPGVRLRGGVVEATYAAAEPELLKRLRQDGVPYMVDPQTVRFAGARFMQVDQFERLPYTPPGPVEANALTSSAAHEFARAVMRFQQDAGAPCYVAAAMPYGDHDLQGRISQNDRLLSAACAANGTGDTERRPLVAQVVVGRLALGEPKLIVNRLIDYPVAAVYVQAQRLNPAKDSVEKLVHYVDFLLELQNGGLNVIAGRVGAFGLVLQALGIPAFDSGLCQAEAFDLASLNRPLTECEQRRRRDGRGRGGDRRVYIELLKTTLQGKHARAVLADRQLRGRFTCTLGCCEHRGFDALPDRRRQHYLWVRHHEVDGLRSRPTGGLRVDWIHEQLQDARGAGTAVRKVLAAQMRDLPSFEHLDRWIGVLAREAQLSAVA